MSLGMPEYDMRYAADMVSSAGQTEQCEAGASSPIVCWQCPVAGPYSFQALVEHAVV